jgi:23S rRNA (adenine2503-C2)-methyltransferase
MGCRFCETAQMGLMRSLSPAEIVAQLHAARFAVVDPATGAAGLEIKNVVFMGMGEPMDNLESVVAAIRVLTDRNACAIAPVHVTVSTVGRTEGIRRYGELLLERGFHRLNLAVSLNAPNDRIRSEIMPVNRAEPIARLMEALAAFPKRPNAAICMEYVLIPGVNDAPEHCDEVCALLRPLRCSLNVIPYNPRRGSPWPAPDEDRVRAFVDRAIANGQFCKRRGTKGRSAMAACGQLGNEAIRNRRWVGADAPGPRKEIVEIRVADA